MVNIKYNKFGNQDVTKNGRVLGRGGPRDLQRKQMMGMIGDDTQSIVIETLKEQITQLTKELSNKPTAGGYSADEVNKEIMRAVEQAVKETKQSTKNEIEGLNKTIKGFELIVKDYEGQVENYKKELLEVNDVIIKSVEEATITTKNNFTNKVTSLESEIHILEDRLKSKDEIIKSKDNVIESLKSAIVYGGNVEFTDGSDRPQIENVFVDPLDKDSGKSLESFINIENSTDGEENISNKVDKLKSLLGNKLPGKIE